MTDQEKMAGFLKEFFGRYRCKQPADIVYGSQEVIGIVTERDALRYQFDMVIAQREKALGHLKIATEALEFYAKASHFSCWCVGAHLDAEDERRHKHEYEDSDEGDVALKALAKIRGEG